MCGEGERSTAQQQASRTEVQPWAGETTAGKYGRNHAEVQQKNRAGGIFSIIVMSSEQATSHGGRPNPGGARGKPLCS